MIGMACHLSGMSLKLWEFVAPHGVLELPAIFLAGGAGLRIASGLLFPGYLPRRESLVRAGSEAVQLLLGSIQMCIRDSSRKSSRDWPWGRSIPVLAVMRVAILSAVASRNPSSNVCRRCK